MLKAETTAARAPRGTKPVSQAFFTALESVPEASRSAVAKAAQAMIREELKARREKLKIAAAKEKARQPVAAKVAAKPTVAKASPAKPAAKKRAAPKRPAEVAAPDMAEATAEPEPKRRGRKSSAASPS